MGYLIWGITGQIQKPQQEPQSALKLVIYLTQRTLKVPTAGFPFVWDSVQCWPVNMIWITGILKSFCFQLRCIVSPVCFSYKNMKQHVSYFYWTSHSGALFQKGNAHVWWKEECSWPSVIVSLITGTGSPQVQPLTKTSVWGITTSSQCSAASTF